ncbi:MAG: hypothetical protein JO202_17470 [Ktedonobacteraceae bacterium]|nr:hypothetical protein [Ktedonobacteraceae bacterium]
MDDNKNSRLFILFEESLKERGLGWAIGWCVLLAGWRCQVLRRAQEAQLGRRLGEEQAQFC